MKDQNELFIVEHENGEWVDSTGDGGWSCWTTQAEAQDALDSEADNCEDQRIVYKIVRFVREAQPLKKLAPRCTSDPNTCDVAFCSWPNCTEPGLR